VPPDPLAFQAECMRAFVASWTVRGFAAATIGDDAALERMLVALGRPAWRSPLGTWTAWSASWPGGSASLDP
jgi:hypothetical protein